MDEVVNYILCFTHNLIATMTWKENSDKKGARKELPGLRYL